MKLRAPVAILLLALAIALGLAGFAGTVHGVPTAPSRGTIKYVGDVTLPDRSLQSPGTYTKIWLVQAVGNVSGMYLQRVIPHDAPDTLRVGALLSIQKLQEESWTPITRDIGADTAPDIVNVPDMQSGTQSQIVLTNVTLAPGKKDHVFFYRTVYKAGNAYVPTQPGYAPLWIDVKTAGPAH